MALHGGELEGNYWAKEGSYWKIGCASLRLARGRKKGIVVGKALANFDFQTHAEQIRMRVGKN